MRDAEDEEEREERAINVLWLPVVRDLPSVTNGNLLTTRTRNKEKSMSITMESSAHGLALASHGICTIRERYRKLSS